MSEVIQESIVDTTVSSEAIPAEPPVLPLELVDKCIGSKIWVVMKNEKGEDFLQVKKIRSVHVIDSSFIHI